MNIPKSAMKDVKKLSAEFRQKLLEIEEQHKNDGDTVYQINIQVFPMTK